MNHEELSRRLVEWWQATDDKALDVSALERAIAEARTLYGNEWESAVLDAFMAPPSESPHEHEAPAEKSTGSALWPALQAIAAVVIALMAMVFVGASILRGRGDGGVEPTLTPTPAGPNVAPTVQALSGQLDALALQVEALREQLEKALNTPTPVSLATPTDTPTPTPSPTPIPSPPPVIGLKGRVEPPDLAQKIALSVKNGEAVTPATTGAFTLTLPAGWEGPLRVEWTAQGVVVKAVAPEDVWVSENDPWSGFVTSIQSQNPVSAAMPLPDLVLTLESVPQPEKFVSRINGTFSEAQGAQRRAFPAPEGTGRSGKIAPVLILGKTQVSKKEWYLACCEETNKQKTLFFWASYTDRIIRLDDENQVSKLSDILLPDGVNSISASLTGWTFEEVDGISVLFNQSGSAQELIWSLAAPAGWFKLQAWVAAGSTAQATYEVLIGSKREPLQPIAGATVVPPAAADAMSNFADIGVYHLARSQTVTVRLKAPAEGKVGVGLIRVLKPEG